VTSHPDVEGTADAMLVLLAPLCREQGRMLGVLLVDGKWVVTLSGGASVPEKFHDTVAEFDPHIATFAHDRYEVPARSLGGHRIAEVLATRGSAAARPATWGQGCACAAPKLISYWTQPTGRPYVPPKRVHMVEVWCGKASDNRQHGERAFSCATCGAIMPTLLCRAPVLSNR
jgi:hypothetical protein